MFWERLTELFPLSVQVSICSNFSTTCCKHAKPFRNRYLTIYGKRKRSPFVFRKDHRGRIKQLETSTVSGNKKIPFDIRIPISTKDVAHTKWGGSLEVAKRIGQDKRRFPHPPGYINEKGGFVVVPEMIPEFIVPDLTDFQLKPYVSYKATEINQDEFTSDELFKATYFAAFRVLYKKGKVKDLDKFFKDFKEGNDCGLVVTKDRRVEIA